jgi:hypothetical protein
MTEITQRTQVSTSELPDAERRRRLASVYRLLIELGQREGSAAEKCQVDEEVGENHKISDFARVHQTD